MNLLLPPASPTLTHVSEIVGLGSQFQMGRVDADRSITFMPYDKATWNRTVRHLVGRSVGSCDPAVLRLKCPVTSGFPSSGPVPAVLGASDSDTQPEVVGPGHLNRSMLDSGWCEGVTVANEPVVVAATQATRTDFAPTFLDGTDTIRHGANSNLVESYVPGSFARPGDTYIVAGRG